MERRRALRCGWKTAATIRRQNCRRQLKFIAAARKRPEIGSVYTAFGFADTPGYQLDIDRDKVAKEGVSLSNLYSTLQSFYGSYQIGDFTMFGRNFKVVVQAAPEFRETIDANNHICNGANQLVPIVASGQLSVRRRSHQPFQRLSGHQDRGSGEMTLLLGDARKPWKKSYGRA